MMKKLVSMTSILALLGLSELCEGYFQELNLYKNENRTGAVARFREHIPWLNYCHDDWTLLCFRGFWMGYEYPDYDGRAKEIHGQDDQEFCMSRNEIDVNSFRHAGQVETNFAAISIYNMYNYEGSEVLFNGVASALLHGLSLVVSTASEWTFFEEINFFGPSVCLSLTDPPPLVGFVGVSNVTQAFGFKQVGSVIKGCG